MAPPRVFEERQDPPDDGRRLLIGRPHTGVIIVTPAVTHMAGFALERREHLV
jgi:hypothetical protein